MSSKSKVTEVDKDIKNVHTGARVLLSGQELALAPKETHTCLNRSVSQVIRTSQGHELPGKPALQKGRY